MESDGNGMGWDESSGVECDGRARGASRVARAISARNGRSGRNATRRDASGAQNRDGMERNGVRMERRRRRALRICRDGALALPTNY